MARGCSERPLFRDHSSRAAMHRDVPVQFAPQTRPIAIDLQLNVSKFDAASSAISFDQSRNFRRSSTEVIKKNADDGSGTEGKAFKSAE